MSAYKDQDQDQRVRKRRRDLEWTDPPPEMILPRRISSSRYSSIVIVGKRWSGRNTSDWKRALSDIEPEGRIVKGRNGYKGHQRKLHARNTTTMIGVYTPFPLHPSKDLSHLDRPFAKRCLISTRRHLSSRPRSLVFRVERWRSIRVPVSSSQVAIKLVPTSDEGVRERALGRRLRLRHLRLHRLPRRTEEVRQ